MSERRVWYGDEGWVRLRAARERWKALDALCEWTVQRRDAVDRERYGHTWEALDVNVRALAWARELAQEELAELKDEVGELAAPQMQKNLGTRLREMRGSESQESFCRKIKQKQGTYSAWERGDKIPSSSAIALISHATGYSTDWILGLTDHRTTIRGGEK